MPSRTILWDTSSGGIVREWFIDSNAAITFSPDSSRIASQARSNPPEITIWDRVPRPDSKVVTISILSDLHHHKLHDAARLIWSSDGTRLVSCTDSQLSKIHVWKIGSTASDVCDLLHVIEPPPFQHNSLQVVSHDASWVLVSASDEARVQIWDLTAGTVRATLGERDGGYDGDSLVAAGFDTPSKTLVAIYRTGAILRWSVPAGDLLHPIHSLNTSIRPPLMPSLDMFQVSQGGKFLFWRGRIPRKRSATSTTRKKKTVIYIIEAESGDVVWSTSCPRVHCNAALSPDGGYFAISDSKRGMQLWRTRDWTCIVKDTHPTRNPAKLAFSEDGELLAIGGCDGTVSFIRVRDLEDA